MESKDASGETVVDNVTPVDVVSFKVANIDNL